MRREPILLLLVFVVLGLMTYSLLQKQAPRASRVVGSKQLEEYSLSAIDPVMPLEAVGNRRDLLRRPSADEPLAALQLPDPELESLATLMPPPIPDCGAAYWSESLLRSDPQILGGVEDLVETQSDTPSLQGLELSAAATFANQDDQYRNAYDWIRLNPLATLYGHLLGTQRYDYVNGDVLKFTQVDPHTGRTRFGEVEFSAEQYEDFGFADNLHNRIELGVREQRSHLSAARLGELNDYVHWLLAQGLAEPNAFEYAEELALAAVRLSRDDVSNWMLLGEVWERSFQLDRAFALYATLADEDLPLPLPEFGLKVETGRFLRAAGPRVRMGMILRRIGLDADAEGQFRIAVNLASGDASAPLEYGVLLLDQGRVEEATVQLQRAMSMQGQRNSKTSLRNALALGRAALRAGHWNAALEAYRNAERAAGSDEEEALQAQAGLIAAIYLQGDFAAARTMAGEAVERFGANGNLLYLRGITEAAAGGAAGEVIRDLRAAVASAPLDAAPAWSAQAFWLDRIGETEAAQEALANALELAPTHIYSRYLLVHWSARDGDLAGARRQLEDLVQIAPQCAAILAEYGSLLYSQGSHTRAEVAFRSLEDLFPDWVQNSLSVKAWSSLVLLHGLNLLRMGSVELAMSAFDQALSMDAELLSARNAKALALYQQADINAAVAEFAYLQDSLRETEEHPQYIYAATWKQRMLDHAKLRRWIDRFDGRRLRPGWDTQSGARAGVEPRLEGGSLLIQGEHSGAAETRVFRTVAGVAFRDFAADLQVGKNHRAEAAVFVGLQNRSKETWSFRVVRNREGLVSWVMMRGSRSEEGKSEFRIPEGGTARVSFHLNREPKQPVLTVRVNDDVLYSESVTNLRNPTGRMAVGLVVRTALALPVEASLDNVELVYATP